MGGVFVYNQSEAILQQYDLEIKQISRGRGAYICETNEGTKLLTPFRGSKERAMFLRDVLSRLNESGIAAEHAYEGWGSRCNGRKRDALLAEGYGLWCRVQHEP